MKEGTPQGVQNLREECINAGYEYVATFYGGRDVAFYVQPEPENFFLPNFSRQASFKDSKTGKTEIVIAVSDKVPPHLRAAWALHEQIEFVEIGVVKRGRCAEAERRTYRVVPGRHKEEFLALRAKFFEDVARLFESDPEHYSQEDVDEIRAAREFIREETDSLLELHTP